MLRRIEAENFFVFEDFAVDFPAGMAVITGETGSGKSVLLRSMGLVLGDSFQYDLIRDPRRETRIRVSFELSDKEAARRWLSEHQLNNADNTLEILRSARYKKSSRACVNGHNIDLTQLRELAEFLVEVHGQQARHGLFGHRAQLAAIDDYAQNGDLLRQTRALAGEIAQIRAEIAQIRGENPESIDLLRYQFEELASADLNAEQWEQLQAEHRRLSNYEQYRAALDQLSQLLSGDDDDALLQRLDKASALASAVREDDHKFAEIAEMIERARIELQEAGKAVNTLSGQDDHESDRAGALAQLEARIAALFDLARKHKVEPAGLYEHYRRMQEDLNRFGERSARLSELDERERSQSDRWRDLASQIGQRRRAQSGPFAAQVNTYLHQLNMPYADFRVEFEERPPDEIHPAGRERARFLISTVAGRPHEPINRISSGGELSRLSLAVRLCANQRSSRGTDTLVFDEIDAGIGGESADRLGRLLGQLSASQQILCVTHLATVAAYASAHYQIGNRRGRKSVYIRALHGNERKQELARMLTGDSVGERSLHAAQELLERAGRSGLVATG